VDPIIGDTFLTLAGGGTICIPSEDQRKNDIVGAMSCMRVSLAKFTPSLIKELTNLIPAKVPTLKTLILGGETTPTTVLQEWADKVDLKLVYGSTECTISCVVPDASTSTVVPGEIGRPFGSQVWVVKPSDGSDLRLVTEGEVGELVVEGPLVARGYMNNSTRSESKFIKRSAHRMYRTGDLVRRLEDGRLVYVGRVDNQLKIRGQRLELEEVEEHVRRSINFPDIRIKNVLIDAAVPLGATSKQLVALLSLETNNPFGSLLCGDEKGGATVSLSPTTRHNFANILSLLEPIMKSIVPSYMVPSLWVPIDKMPYTLSRKLDRQRLRRAIESLPAKWLAAFSRTDDGLPDGEDAGSVVTTEKENLLRRLWSDILGSDPGSIRPSDNFSRGQIFYPRLTPISASPRPPGAR
jgi:acyl-coenzyme A synthetase/AMP-(fatty) acid ligase